MMVAVLGINHKLCNLNLREKVAKAVAKHLHPKSIYLGFSFVLLSTCNRVEIYFSSEDLSWAHSVLLQILRSEIDGPFEHFLYSYFHYDCFCHLVHVTLGLDSAIIKETEIQGQVKLAYKEALFHRSLAKELHFMFQKTFKIAKEMRTHFFESSNTISLNSVIKNRYIEFALKENEPILFVGASKINCALIEYFKVHHVTSLYLTNRSKRLIPIDGVKEIDWNNKIEWLRFKVIIIATKSPQYLLNEYHFQNIQDSKLLFDLSVPRNVDPLLKRHDNIKLLNIDDLASLVGQEEEEIDQGLEKLKMQVSNTIKHQIYLYLKREKNRAITALKNCQYV